MKRCYIITGAAGHLGGTIIRILQRRGVEIRGLVQEGERPAQGEHTSYFCGDVRDVDSLRPLFEQQEQREVIVLHTAGMINIARKVSEQMHEVNVQGTKNMLSLCRDYKVKRLVYVSSVHVIPEGDQLGVLTEVTHFSPDEVEGGYAKTKAEATQAVLDAVHVDGLDAVVVHPSGILGPYESVGNHLVQMVESYMKDRLPALVVGGYDFVDVRDVARGCLAAADHGKSGACYILSNRHYEMKELMEMVRREHGGRRLPAVPIWMARCAVPAVERYARRKGKRPLYTAYSLHTLSSNDRFSHDKATRELGYSPRDLRETIRDTVRWISRDRQGS